MHQIAAKVKSGAPISRGNLSRCPELGGRVLLWAGVIILPIRFYLRFKWCFLPYSRSVRPVEGANRSKNASKRL